MKNIKNNLPLQLLIISVWALFCSPCKVEAESIHFDTIDTAMGELIALEPYNISEPDYAPWELSGSLLSPAHIEPETEVLENYEPANEDAISAGNESHPSALLSKPEIILLFGTSITGVVWIGFRRKKKIFDPAPESHV